ncbi:PREDICTED: corticotropin-releasing factor receptor 2-like, partial [Chlamydotis macqueenii]|uniref:corticotropin-releasing factor receptor 2-like n=1 Tax=Chlamydotis macqueenii TaxID=187382 RepID=UPI000529D90A
NAYRECLGNGTWASKINYSQCEPILDDKRKYALHYKIALIINYLGHCISVGALIVAFMLFLCLRSIRCLRNIIHWNLITTFILRNVMWFLLQMIDHNIHESNEPWCRCITTVYNYFVVTNFFWMFVEGCYLHTAIVMTYSTDKLRKWVFLFIGWCSENGLKDIYKDDGAEFLLVVADVIRRDNGHKLQTGRFQLDIKKTENLPK